MSMCMDQYLATVADADAKLASDIAACNGDLECERIAVDAHYQSIVAAYEAYINCAANQEGEPGGN